MRIYILLLIPLLAACSKQSASAHPPVGGFLSQTDLQISKSRSKNLNALERMQIEDWIKDQNEKYYSMSMNYWVNDADLAQHRRKANGEKVSYEYDLYDFDMVKLYSDPKVNTDVTFGRFEELRAVEDALRYMEKGQEVTLLVPSALGFGTYGDNDRIPNDMPLIIKLKVL